MGRVAWEALARSPGFRLFLRCLKQVSCTYSQVIDPAGLFTSLYYGWSINNLSVLPVFLDWPGHLPNTSAHSFTVSAVSAVLQLTVLTSFFPDFC